MKAQLQLTNISTRRKRPPYRIYISVNGEGYGHSSRALAVARYLDPETVVFGSYGYVLDRLERSGYTCVEVQPEVKFFGEDGSFELSKTIWKNSNLPLLVNKQIRQEQQVMEDLGITCVLSDCRFTPILAAARLGLPSLYMTNQTQFEHFFQRSRYRESNGQVLVGRKSRRQSTTLAEAPKAIQDAILSGAAEPGVDFVVKTIFREVNEIIVADYLPPDTVCLPMLSPKPQVMRLQRLVGPVLGWRAYEVFPQLRQGYGPYVVGTLGGHQYREPLFDALIDAANKMPHVHFDIFSSFRVPNQPKNLRLIDFTDNPECYYKAADLVVTQAGHSTAMELLALGKPSLLVPDYKQIEQESNAQRLVELGVSTQIVYPELSGQLMAERIKHHLETRSYEKAAYRLAALADSLGGAQKVADVLKEYALRVKAY